MRLTLDWDTDALKEMHLPAVRSREAAQDNQRRIAEFVGEAGQEAGEKWELWHSSGHGHGDSNGWHYIEYDRDGDLETMRQLRTAYGDDKLRVSLDGDRLQNGSPYPQVLYHMKGIKPGEHKPYETEQRAQLVERHGFDGDRVSIKNADGSLDYAKITELLADHEDFGSRAALYRRIQQRDSVTVSTRPSARAYDIAKGRRSPTRNEAKALRDYAEARDLGHYGEEHEGVPEDLAEKPTRTLFHEYFSVPDIEFNAYDFGEGDGDGDGDSTWLPANLRTGTYGDVDEMTLKQVHDRIADKLVDVLSPGTYQQQDGKRVWMGVDISRLRDGISLSRERPLDPDEKARYRRVFWQNQPGTTEEQVHEKVERRGIRDPFDGDAVMWECIVYNEDYEGVWWIVRGVLDASDKDAVRSPVANSAIVADTEGWI